MKSYGVIHVYKGRKYYFITIAEVLNITRAAERLMVSQPSLTQYLNHLENELEVKLVDRNSRRCGSPGQGSCITTICVTRRRERNSSSRNWKN